MILEEVKEYLWIDTNEHDTYIQELITMSEIYTDSCVGVGYRNNENLVRLSEIAKKKLIYDMYENRSSYIEDRSKRDIIVTTIFDKLANAGDVI